MWMEKLFAGVLRVLTPLGPRYIRPSMAQRIYLLWVFRHFQVLPLQVLTRRHRRVIDALCVEPRFVPLAGPDGWEAPILGTLERRPPIAQGPCRPNTRVTDTVSSFGAADLYNAKRHS
jgi:hypothetical protein